MAGLVGGVPGVNASLLIVPGSGHASVTMTTRFFPIAIEGINARLPRPNA
jgi:hypothetical protein